MNKALPLAAPILHVAVDLISLTQAASLPKTGDSICIHKTLTLGICSSAITKDSPVS